ncbi:hypothetical protein B0T11DRAFT_141653 [Plectosphaerella cucumerina]|uniref:Uncharacterized protein n=1 Tax=Plectosphaerella cucumerina TaxID=40658 RepID=A0A8K0TA63_9PEZI|nr:hypothetical protein B0T11DRAFT_141653 [Plectosphaerella cucumerina]
MAPRRSLAPAILLLLAFAHAALALRFVENEWDLKRGQAINISWEEATEDVNIGIYLARKVPGRAELQLNLNLTAEDQKNGFVIFNVPNTFLDGLYQFNVWGDGSDYRLQVMGDAEAIFSSGGLSTAAKAAIVIGVLLILSGILAAVLYVLRRRGIINKQDGHTALSDHEADAFHERSGSTAKPTPEYHHTAEVSGDQTYHGVGGADRVEMNDLQSHNALGLSRSDSRSDTQEQDRGASNRYSQAVSNISEPPEYGRSSPQRYSMASQPDEYVEFPTIPHRFSQSRVQKSPPAYGQSYQTPADHDAQTYGHDRRQSDTQNLITAMPDVDAGRHRRQSYQSPPYAT